MIYPMLFHIKKIAIISSGPAKVKGISVIFTKGSADEKHKRICARSSVFNPDVLLLLALRPAFGAGCVFAKAVGERQAGPGTISDTLKIKEQCVADP